jgi:hypothetical protein
MALLGVAFAAYVWFGLLKMQDRRPARDIVAPEIGRSFEVKDIFGKPEGRITVTRGERQNQHAAGGDRADRDYIKLFVTYEAIAELDPESFAWHIDSAGMDTSAQYAFVALTPSTRLAPGQTATGTVSFYDIVTGSPATITYQGIFDKVSLYSLVVAP